MYNEENNIGVHLQNIREVMEKSEYPYRVMILNDGSTDRSGGIVDECAGKMPLIRIDHSSNKGLGTTLADILKEAAKRTDPDDIVVTMDADGSHHPQTICSMIPKLSEGNDIVIASRFVKGGKQVGLPLYRRLCSIGARLVLSTLFHIRGVRDYTCGYRAYRAELIKEFVEKYKDRLIESIGFPGMGEILIKMNQLKKIRIEEIPLILRYDLKQSMSKMNLFKTIFEYFRLILLLNLRK